MKPQNLCTVAILLSLALSGCDEGRKTPTNTSVSVVHAAPTTGFIGFRREEALEATLDFRQTAVVQFNVDVYDFHFDITPAGGESLRPVSFVQEIVADTSYTIVAAELGGQLQQLVLETPTFDADSSDVQAMGLHLAPMFGAVDIYLLPPGTDPAAAVPIGSLDFEGQLAPISIAAGEVEVVLTEASDPATVLFRSVSFTLTAGQSVLFTVVDGAGVGFVPVSVLVSGGSNVALVDSSLDSRIRVINTLSDQSSLDIGIDGDLTPPLITGLTYGTVSAYTSITPGSSNLTGSPAGNPSVLEVDFPFTADAGRFATFLISGAPGAATIVFSADDTRPISGEAKLNIYNGAALFAFVDIFITLPGTDLSTIPPTSSIAAGGSVPNLPIAAAEYEITIRDGGTETVLAGPTTITLDDSGLYGILLTDSAGGATVDLTLFDDFN